MAMLKAQNVQDFTDSYALKAIRERLVADTCAGLKARVMAIIEPEIDAACERAAQSLKPAIEAYANRNLATGTFEHIIRIVTEKRSPK